MSYSITGRHNEQKSFVRIAEFLDLTIRRRNTQSIEHYVNNTLNMVFPTQISRKSKS